MFFPSPERTSMCSYVILTTLGLGDVNVVVEKAYEITSNNNAVLYIYTVERPKY